MLPEGFDPTGGCLGLVGRGASQGASPLAFEFVYFFFFPLSLVCPLITGLISPVVPSPTTGQAG